MMPNFKTIDTLKEARKGFRFNSNRLDYISKFGGSTGKIGTSFDLWKKIVLNKCDKSLKYMVKYCKKDVIELETVFNKMNKYIKPKTSVATCKSDCPECGNNHVRNVRVNVGVSGIKQHQFQCHECHKYFTVSEKNVRVVNNAKYK